MAFALLGTEASEVKGMGLIRNEHGTTLVESVLSIMVMLVGLLGSVMLMHNTSLANVNSKFQMLASQLAQERLEEIIADNFQQAQQFDYVVNQNYPDENIDYRSTVGLFTRNVNVIEVADDLATPLPGSSVKRVTVVVSWGTLPHERVAVTTLVTNYD